MREDRFWTRIVRPLIFKIEPELATDIMMGAIGVPGSITGYHILSWLYNVLTWEPETARSSCRTHQWVEHNENPFERHCPECHRIEWLMGRPLVWKEMR